jgi:hypothetical protein
MKYLALLIAAFVIVVGVVGIAAPDRLIVIGWSVLTPAGIYGIAALRIGIGIVVMLVASRSRAPRALRALGAIVVVAGLITPLFGVERSRAVLNWEVAQGTALLRATAVLVLAIGGFLAFAVSNVRRPA